MCLIFVGQGYPRKLFNLEHFPIYGSTYNYTIYANLTTNTHNKHSIPVMHIIMYAQHSGSQAGTVNSTILLKHCYDHMDSIKIIEL